MVVVVVTVMVMVMVVLTAVDVESGFMNDLNAMIMRKCVVIGSRRTYPLQMYTQRQRRRIITTKTT